MARRLTPLATRALLAFCSAVLATQLWAAEPPEAVRPVADGAATELEPKQAALQERLSGATLVGRYTVTGQAAGQGAGEDKYTIRRLTKLKGDYWLFDVRIEYGEHDVTVPLPLKVLWAGETPVITVDKVGIPGLGTYTARVVISGGRYAGTWSGKDHGGHLYGRIEGPTDDDEAKSK